MPNDATLEANERMRWATMDSHRLRIRLNKIKKPEKLAWFMQVAMEQHEDELFELAAARAAELRVGHLSMIRRVIDVYYLRRQSEMAYRPHVTEPVDVRRALTRKAKKEKPKPAVRKIRF